MKKIIFLIAVYFLSIASYGQSKIKVSNSGNSQNKPSAGMLGVYNVSDYGGIGDNSTNNDSAFARTLRAIISKGGGVMYIPAGIYIGKIIIPKVPYWMSIEIRGEFLQFPLGGTIGTAILPNSGTIIKSLSTSGSVISVDTDPSGFSGFNSVLVSLKDLDIRTYDNPQINGVDLNFAQSVNIDNIFVNTGIYGVQASFPSYGKSGIILPKTDNDANITVTKARITGYYNGMVCSEHTSAINVSIYECVNAIKLLTAYHASNFFLLDLERNTNNIYVAGVHRFNVSQLNIEHADSATQTDENNKWQVTQYDLKDTANLGIGEIVWASTKGGSGPQSIFKKISAEKIITNEIGVNNNIVSSKIGGSFFRYTNTNSGTTSSSAFQAKNDGIGAATLGVTSSTFTTSGILSSNMGYLASGGILGIISSGNQNFSTDGGTSTKASLLTNGNFGLGVTTPLQKLEVNGNILATQYRISALNTAPASATDTGTTGEIRITAGFIYVCTATNTWVRTALSTF